MKFARFIDPFLAAAETGSPNPDWFDLACSESKIRTILVDIVNSGHRLKCESCSTVRSGNKLVFARSATKNSRITTMWSRTTGIRREWVERGATITLTISKQYIGGVTMRKGQRE